MSIKKLFIENVDRKELAQLFRENNSEINVILNGIEQKIGDYVVGIDLANPDSKDYSAITHYHTVKGKVIVDGVDIL